MHIPILWLMMILAFTPSLASDNPDPETRLRIAYLSVALPAFVELALPLDGSPTSTARAALAPCSPLTILKIKGDRTVTIDRLSVRRELRGDWSPYLHDSPAACRERAGEAGPKLMSGGGLFVMQKQ